MRTIGRLLLVPLAMLAALAVGTLDGCTTDAELAFVNQVRNSYDGLAVEDVADDQLVALGRATCDLDGLDVADRARLAALGVDDDEFVRLALPLCPSR